MSQIIDTTATLVSAETPASETNKTAAKNQFKAFLLKKLVGAGYFLAAVTGFLIGGIFLAALMLIAYGSVHLYFFVKRVKTLAAEEKLEVVEKVRQEGEKYPWEYLVTDGHVIVARLNSSLVVRTGQILGLMSVLLFIGNMNGGFSKQLEALLTIEPDKQAEIVERVRPSLDWTMVTAAANPPGIDPSTLTQKDEVWIDSPFMDEVVARLNAKQPLACEPTTKLVGAWLSRAGDVPLCNPKPGRVWMFSLVKSTHRAEAWMIVFIKKDDKWEGRYVLPSITRPFPASYVTVDMVSHSLISDFDDLHYLKK